MLFESDAALSQIGLCKGEDLFENHIDINAGKLFFRDPGKGQKVADNRLATLDLTLDIDQVLLKLQVFLFAEITQTTGIYGFGKYLHKSIDSG